MRLTEFIEKEGFFSDFKKGFNSVPGSSRSTSKAKPEVIKSPFDIIPSREAKNILANIINGKPLDQRQMSQIKQVYNKL